MNVNSLSSRSKFKFTFDDLYPSHNESSVMQIKMSVLTKAGYPLSSLLRFSCPRLRRGDLYLTQRRASSAISLNPLNWFTRSSDKQSTQSSVALEVASAKSEPDYHEEDVLECIEGHTHKFIPITRGTLLKTLVMEKGMFSAKERLLLDDFAAALDAYYSQKFYGILEESKVCMWVLC